MKFKGNYISGEFKVSAQPAGEWTAKSPADLDDILGKVNYSYTDVDRAVESARDAFKVWKKTKFEDRVSLLKKYQTALKKREKELAETISREMGKPLWESKTEVAAMVGKVDIAITAGMDFIKDYELSVSEGVTGVCRHRPLGVVSVLGPFNFPGHLPNGHIVPALAAGNTVIFKPSEKTSLTGQVMAECFDEAGLPSGVFNLLVGEKEVGRRLCVHEGVSGVFFTGSYEVGTRIKQDTLQQHWKLLALEMGGKNPAIVWKDAQLENAVSEVLFGAFVTTGQRCSATSRVLIHSKVFDQFVSLFHEKSKAFSIGHPSSNPFMGSLIDGGSVDRYLKFMGIASREGFEILMRGKVFDSDRNGYYVTPSICLDRKPTVEKTKKSVFQQTELFAPSVAFLEVDDLDQAIELANLSQYGLASSVFSADRGVYEKALSDLEYGLVNWNKSTVGASSKLPFGGLKKSGNHRPTAVTAGQYCVYPVASMEMAPQKNFEAPKHPGLNW